MNKKILASVASAAMLALPLLVAAQNFNAGPTPSGDQNVDINQIVGIILDFMWPIVIGVAVIMFIIAGFLFMTARGDETKLAAARSALIWGAVGVAVAVLAFSIPFAIREQIDSTS